MASAQEQGRLQISFTVFIRLLEILCASKLRQPPSRLRLTMLSTRGRSDSRKTDKGGPSFPANQVTKKAQTAPRRGSRRHTRQISPSEPLENWYKDQLLDKLEELHPVKSGQLQRAKVTTIIRAIRNLGFDPESRHALSESNTQQQQQQHPQQQLQLASQQQQQQNECGTLDQDKSDSDDVVRRLVVIVPEAEPGSVSM